MRLRKKDNYNPAGISWTRGATGEGGGERRWESARERSVHACTRSGFPLALRRNYAVIMRQIWLHHVQLRCCHHEDSIHALPHRALAGTLAWAQRIFPEWAHRVSSGFYHSGMLQRARQADYFSGNISWLLAAGTYLAVRALITRHALKSPNPAGAIIAGEAGPVAASRGLRR